MPFFLSVVISLRIFHSLTLSLPLVRCLQFSFRFHFAILYGFKWMWTTTTEKEKKKVCNGRWPSECATMLSIYIINAMELQHFRATQKHIQWKKTIRLIAQLAFCPEIISNDKIVFRWTFFFLAHFEPHSPYENSMNDNKSTNNAKFDMWVCFKSF